MAYAADTTVREAILADIQTTLEGITTAGGFKNQVQKVYRVPVDIDKIQSFPSLVIGMVAGEYEHNSDTLYAVTMTVPIRALIEKSGDPALETEISNIIADVTKALAADPFRGQKASWTHVSRTRPWVTSLRDTRASVDIDVLVLYQFKRTDPTTR